MIQSEFIVGAQLADKPTVKEKKYYIAYLLFLIAFVLLFSKNEKRQSAGEKSQASINSELKAADLKVQFNRALMEDLNAQVREQAKTSGKSGMPSSSLHMRISTESHAIQVAEENRQDELPGTFRVRNLDESILQRVADQQFAGEYDEAYKKAYIRAFLQNARENGLDVVLNEDLEVLEILPFNNGEPMRFPNAVDGSSQGSK